MLIRRSIVTAFTAVATASLTVVALMTACSSSTSSGAPSSCTPGPSACGESEVCWPVDVDGGYGCVTARSGAGLGASCQNTLGIATCDQGLACDQTSAANGVCTDYCTTATACAGGYTCDITHVGSANGPTIQICRLGDAGLGIDVNDDGAVEITPVYIDGAIFYDASDPQVTPR